MATIAQRIATTLTTKLAKTVGALALVFAVLLATPLAASANAYGFAGWGGAHLDVKINRGGVEVGPIRLWIPGGKLGHGIVSNGARIYSDKAEFETLNPFDHLCEYSVRFTYGYGAYETYTPFSETCSPNGGWEVTYNGWEAPAGKACAE